MTAEKKHPCETCALRRKAEEKPRSLLGILWRLHTKICPGWKAYQRSLREG
jgi:hypothetical protein